MLKLWWDLGGSDRSDFSLAQHRRNVLLQLADRLAAVPNKPISINDLAPETIAELKSAGILRDKDLGHSAVFTHDIYEEWAVCQLLISRSPDLATFLTTHNEADLFNRPVQLFGTYLLETKPSVDDWKALYENVGEAALRPVWQRAVLTSCLHSTRATQLLHGIADYLLDNNGDRLRKMLMAVATTEVVPNPIFLDEKLTPDVEPTDRAMLAHHTAVPKALTWVRFLDWLMPLVPNLPPQLIPDLLPVFKTWQNAFAGNKVRHCRQIGELSYGWLNEVEEAHHARDWRKVRESFGGALKGRDIEKSLRALFLSSVGDVPHLGPNISAKRLPTRRTFISFASRFSPTVELWFDIYPVNWLISSLGLFWRGLKTGWIASAVTLIILSASWVSPRITTSIRRRQSKCRFLVCSTLTKGRGCG